MFTLRPFSQRGGGQHGWLDTRHTFSFADYHDPAHMGFRALRVINEDRIAPGQGFGMHPHRDMEILTWVLEGALQHKDSLGHGAVLRPGEAQRITAGTGLLHSEFNPSPTEPVHLYQVWLLPDRRGHAPGYEQKAFPLEPGKWRTIASSDGRDGSLVIRQDASVLVAQVEGPLARSFAPGRHGWLQVLRGEMSAHGHALRAGDGLAISGEPELRLEGAGEAMLFDLP
ncbi:MAG: pirin family protein [Gemmataceae bacterium]|nr:pirin family protein [Gemmataceae bacterium]